MIKLSPEEKRCLFRKYIECSAQMFADWADHNYPYLRLKYKQFPEELRGMTCSAKTRAGTPCKRRDLYNNGRCKLHGGLSTGPRTIKGKIRSALNGNIPKKKRTP